MTNRYRLFHARLLGSAAAIAFATMSGTALAADAKFEIQPQPLDSALREFGVQSGVTILADAELTLSKVSPGVVATADPEVALGQVLAGTGLSYKRDGDVFVIARFAQQEGGSGPQDQSAAGGGAEVEALIVTAQKREEAIQDVPIAISAFSQKALEEQKIEGGFDLVKAIPNVSFSKSNFTSYNFSIRGVGTKAISATTDPGVAVAFNNTTLIQNRLFEQEYFDVERVEVLRGPQGTLYGRNATSGVINVISAKPDLGDFEASIKLEVGNYDSKRAVGMLNIPIVTDMLAVRVAGSMTQRTGYDFNEITNNPVNGRDLWSGRVTVGFEPTSRLRANLLWEHFEEDDNRSRTGKQLCHRDPGLTMIGNTNVEGDPSNPYSLIVQGGLSQGCLPGSLYDDNAFSAPNGLALPFIYAPLVLGSDNGGGAVLLGIGRIDNKAVTFLEQADPYAGLVQSRDLRTIASVRDPIYRAKADLLDLSFDFDITDSLTLTSQTVYNEDEVYSFQDFNRFNSNPSFTDTSQLDTPNVAFDWRNLAPGGVFCDPQIGCTDRVAGFDVSQAVGKQFSQELRVQSAFDGPVNFSVGANYTAFETLIDYYVFYNAITALALTPPFYQPTAGAIDITTCPFSGFYVSPLLGLVGSGPVPAGDPTASCPYIDPNPIESINGDGHNYFRSKNPYELKSRAIFGELYWEMRESLKLTVGLRYTDDTKTFTPVPSQVLLAAGPLGGGTVSRGYPEKDPIVQQWGEWTGRLGLDWKPELAFTDETLLYAFYSRGYKGGGANPPSPGFATVEEMRAYLASVSTTQLEINQRGNYTDNPILELNAVEYGRTFDPEFVNAFELGAKNTLFDGAMTLNVTSFYYDYTDYQISQIRDRTAVNENFDATIWGIEFETVFAPSRNFRIIGNLGYLDTEIAEGESSIDLMNRTQGNPDYVRMRPWVQLPSNCVLPVSVVEPRFLPGGGGASCGGWDGVFGPIGTPPDPNFGGALYDPDNYPELNGGAGLLADLGGNELPNAPHWTTNIGAQYAFDFAGSWRATVRSDAYWQSQSWARVYNAVNDKLHGWYNVNLSLWVENPDWGLKVEIYAKNLLDKTPITDAFLNSDDTGLTTNVFVLDPRLIGLSIRKEF